MDSASRLYERLGNIPQNPDDPESLEDLIVCAFGAFERYYLCWKTKGGEYRQYGYELPVALQEWLFPADGLHRDFATLQVVFGRGEEYFASDKDGKLEHKEPEVIPRQTPADSMSKDGKHSFRRSRTISFQRPHALSDPSPTAAGSPLNTLGTEASHRRLSSVRQIPSRPTNIPITRPTSDPMPKVNQLAEDIRSPPSSRRTSYISQASSTPTTTLSSRPTSNTSIYPSDSVTDVSVLFEPTFESSNITSTRLVRRSTRPLSTSSYPATIPKIPEERKRPSPSPETNERGLPESQHCPCCRRNPSQKQITYADASAQTDPEPLRLNTTGLSTNTNSNPSSAQDTDTPLTDDDLPPPPPPAPNPVIMGRMHDYFSNPGYQLGDSLTSSHSFYYYQQKQHIYTDNAFYIGQALH